MASEGIRNTTVIASRLGAFGTSIFTEMTRLAIEHDAINLAQGFPDFDGPEFLVNAAREALGAGHNQYARPFGLPSLVEQIAVWHERASGIVVDPMAEVTVTSGCTEALCSAMLGLLEPGDEVVVFDPVYDAYPAAASMAGAKLVRVSLREPEDPDEPFWFDRDELRRAFGPKTRAVLLNTPHNPCGKVFTRDELGLIRDLCVEHDVFAISDEVYERLVYGCEHVPLASIEGMRDRTLTCSSLGKTFSMTGWKIGWVVGPTHLMAGVRAAHQFTVFCSATPLQHAAAVALRDGEEYVEGLVAEYKQKRDYLVDALRGFGLQAFRPNGSYFVMADHSTLGYGDDVELCRHLTVNLGVAAIPPTAFYEDQELGKRLVRFAFCKTDAVLEQAVERLSKLKPKR